MVVRVFFSFIGFFLGFKWFRGVVRFKDRKEFRFIVKGFNFGYVM